MKKILFLIFTDDGCKLNHAFLYANELHSKGHTIRIILEGVATKAIKKLESEGNEYFKELFVNAKNNNILVGACYKASNGCSSPENNVVSLMKKHKIDLLQDLNGHSSITEFVEDNYQIIVF